MLIVGVQIAPVFQISGPLERQIVKNAEVKMSSLLLMKSWLDDVA